MSAGRSNSTVSIDQDLEQRLAKLKETGAMPIDRILSEDLLLDDDPHDTLTFLDEIDTLSAQDAQALRNAVSPRATTTSQQGLDTITQDLEKTLSKFLQTHNAPTGSNSLTDESTEQRFGDQLDRLGGFAYSEGTGSGMGGDDDTRTLIEQARAVAAIEARCGSLDQHRMQDLEARHDELKKGVQSLGLQASVAPKEDALGPPPAAVDLDELRLGGGGGHNDENPDDWCCICNEDATWTCPGCDNDHYCEECFRESHIGPDADWEMRKHRPRPFVKYNSFIKSK
ncbi:hypothetical protein BGZ82_005875 [Podila clonocystis]|nr:hypothetical protein BGZ82_005875 [Podila clonocystis]